MEGNKERTGQEVTLDSRILDAGPAEVNGFSSGRKMKAFVDK
jgi:hypothetical protein